MYEYLLLKDSQKDFRGVFGILLNIYHGAFSEITLQFLAVECSLYFVYILQDLVTAKTHVESFIFFFCFLIFWEGAEGGGVRVFLSQRSMIHGTAEKGKGYFFKSTLPLPPASQTLRHYPGDYCREVTSGDSSQSDSNREPLVSEHNSLTNKLREKRKSLNGTNFQKGYYLTRTY